MTKSIIYNLKGRAAWLCYSLHLYPAVCVGKIGPTRKHTSGDKDKKSDKVKTEDSLILVTVAMLG